MFARISTLAAIASLASAAQLDAASGTKANLHAAIEGWGDKDISSFTECCYFGYTEEDCADVNPIMY